MPLLFPAPVPASPQPAQSRWGNLQGSAESLAALSAATAFEGLSLVLARDNQSAEQLLFELHFFAGEQDLLLGFPDWETLPYDSFSPHQDIISERLKTLYQLPGLTRALLVIPVTTLLQRLAPTDFVLGNSLLLAVGDRLDMLAMRRRLSAAGYRQADTVYEHGEFAIRGSVMDIFPMGSTQPYRIDLFDDEIEQLRSFDPESQRTVAQIERIDILPAREFPIDEAAIARFRGHWRAHFEANPTASPIYQDVTSGLIPAGIEYYMPLFFEQTASLFDYLPSQTQILSQAGLPDAVEKYWQDIRTRYEQRRYDTSRPLLPPAEVWLPADQLFGRLNTFPQLVLNQESLLVKAGQANFPCLPAPQFSIDHSASEPLAELSRYLHSHPGRVLFCAESNGRREVLLDLLGRAGIHPQLHNNWQEFWTADSPLGITVAALDRGLVLEQPALALICESQLFGHQVFQRRRRGQAKDITDQVIRSLAELKVGDPVVHLDHGVGRYRGLECIQVGGQANEFLTLEYADGAKLYVPIASLELISRYAGQEDGPAPLHKLGSDKWQKAKRKAAEQIRDTAAELLAIHAQRAARKGIAFSCNEAEYQSFCAEFGFEETPDQEAAIAATLADMQAPRPMDRLVCGDVGFGKTEVAMRAAFVAANQGYQVAVLVPTTLLAQQHFETFSDRFANWPFRIEMLSRFRGKEQQQQTLERLKNGQTDIVIGTHKLITAGIGFNNLGLLVIDEEHRFGVHQKEKIKSLRAEVDILALTATPIPRTLNMALSGIRDISIIASPPAKRLSINTFIHRQEDAIRKEALNRELRRGGQIYLVHNDIDSIERKAEDIAALAPEARVAVAHGQMKERALEQVMSDFYHRRFHVLVCTTIIETGIDVPAANTIIIERADKFGLAQLHQLRGRVGRSHHQAYAYLLIPAEGNITADAAKRLEAIAGAQELGAGFILATHDLEIRGAGELLGDNQSGHIHSIGFALYAEMLDQAVNSLKRGQKFDIEASLQQSLDVNFHLPALIPETYLPDVHTRLILYKRIASAKNDAELQELQVEMIDRFGLLQDPIRNLFSISAIKLKAHRLGVTKLDVQENGARIEFTAQAQVNPQALIRLIQQQPNAYKLEGATRLRYRGELPTSAARFNKITELLDLLAAP